MHALTRLTTSAAALTLITAPATAVTAGTAAASGGGTRVPLVADLRRCDFSTIQTAPDVSRPSTGTGSAVIRTTGSAVMADVDLVVAGQQGTHYDAGLIQEPLPTSANCAPGGPDGTYTGLDLDAAGRASMTLQAPVRQGATGVWVFIRRPAEHSQTPAEFYTSEFVAPI